MSNEALQFYLAPAPGARYAYGLDPGEGKGRDFSSLEVYDIHTGEEAVAFRSNQVDGANLALLAYQLHHHGYRVAEGNLFLQRPGGLVPEENNELLMHELLKGQYAFPPEYFYLQRKGGARVNEDDAQYRPGFRTLGGTKRFLLDNYSEMAERGRITWHSPWPSMEAGRWAISGGVWAYTIKSEMHAVYGHGDSTIASALAAMGVLAWNEQVVEDGVPERPQKPVVYMKVTGGWR